MTSTGPHVVKRVVRVVSAIAFTFACMSVAHGAVAGTVAFTDGQRHIFTVEIPGGTAEEVPLGDLYSWGVAALPQWSPDGTLLTFYGGAGGHADIYVVSPDGTGLRNLTGGAGNYVTPSFSPDGTMVAFNGVYGPLYVMPIDATDISQATRCPVHAALPCWSPNSNLIAYSNWGFTYDSDIFVYDLDTGVSTQLTSHGPNQAFFRAAWSPDGTRLAVVAWDYNTPGHLGDVYVMNADGSGLANLTEGWSSSDEPWVTWSPDGQYVVFSSDVLGDYDIWAAPADGSAPAVKLYGLRGVDEMNPAMSAVPSSGFVPPGTTLTAHLWLTLASPRDFGTYFDVLVEVLDGEGRMVAGGALDRYRPARTVRRPQTIRLTVQRPEVILHGESLTLRVSTRIDEGSGHLSGSLQMEFGAVNRSSRLIVKSSYRSMTLYLHEDGLMDMADDGDDVVIDKMSASASKTKRGANREVLIGTWTFDGF